MECPITSVHGRILNSPRRLSNGASAGHSRAFQPSEHSSARQQTPPGIRILRHGDGAPCDAVKGEQSETSGSITFEHRRNRSSVNLERRGRVSLRRFAGTSFVSSRTEARNLIRAPSTRRARRRLLVKILPGRQVVKETTVTPGLAE